jgi:hypothetical protein
MFGWEGCMDEDGSCYGSCTHVWNYEQATAFLFGDLARSMREVEFLYATRDDGHMSFRVALPLHALRISGWLPLMVRWVVCSNCSATGNYAVMMAGYKSCGPMQKKTLEFCWIPGGWDADSDGVMEGCQHNTMDVEYFGPNPQMQGWYLGALRACEKMARHLATKFSPANAVNCSKRLAVDGRKLVERCLLRASDLATTR